jgi:hypothetical protein
MEPQLPNPNIAPQGSYETPSVLPTPEVVQTREVPKSLEAAPIIESRPAIERQPGPPSTAPIPVPAPVAPVSAVAPPATSSAPSVAADDDVIEKEWINMAKKVLSLTKGDPFQKGHEISKLQADYLEKRYGKQVKVPEDV